MFVAMILENVWRVYKAVFQDRSASGARCRSRALASTASLPVYPPPPPAQQQSRHGQGHHDAGRQALRTRAHAHGTCRLRPMTPCPVPREKPSGAGRTREVAGHHEPLVPEARCPSRHRGRPPYGLGGGGRMPVPDAVLSMVVEHVPSPLAAQERRCGRSSGDDAGADTKRLGGGVRVPRFWPAMRSSALEVSHDKVRTAFRACSLSLPVTRGPQTLAEMAEAVRKCDSKSPHVSAATTSGKPLPLV
jgi:hypothetical protein